MNKELRNIITKLKYKKRLKIYNIKGEAYCFKQQSKPCSCYMCSPYKYSRKIKHNKIWEE
jgi:hypothetical protein